MEWIVGFLVFILLMALLPVALRAARKSRRGKGGVGGFILAFGLAFSGVLDPAQKAASEEIDKSKSNRRRENADGSVD